MNWMTATSTAAAAIVVPNILLLFKVCSAVSTPAAQNSIEYAGQTGPAGYPCLPAAADLTIISSPITPGRTTYMASLQDQLLKAGIVDAKKAKKLVKEKRKETKSQPKGHARVDEAREQARRSQEEKAERDRALNRQLQAANEKKAIQAQIVQLIKMNRIERAGGDTPYQFVDGKKIKKIHVSARLLDELSRGRIAIARLEGGYELLPAAAAKKIIERDESAIVLLNSSDSEAPGDDDPYAAYEIPDDLMW